MNSGMSSAELILKYKELLDQGIITEEEFQEKKRRLLNADEPRTEHGDSILSARATGIIAYITWIGFLVALLLGDKDRAMFHLNQALVVLLFSLLSAIPLIGWLWAIFMFVCWILGIVYAYRGEEKEVPLIGRIKLLT